MVLNRKKLQHLELKYRSHEILIASVILRCRIHCIFKITAEHTAADVKAIGFASYENMDFQTKILTDHQKYPQNSQYRRVPNKLPQSVMNTVYSTYSLLNYILNRYRNKTLHFQYFHIILAVKFTVHTEPKSV